jgi:elongation factor Ts
MVSGRINKYYEQNVLLNQAFVKDGSVSVGQYVASKAKELGGTIIIADYVRYEKGEGLEKRSDNFAEDVAKMVN